MSRNSKFFDPLLLASLLFVSGLTGCSLTSSTTIQYDNPALSEKSCTLNIAGSFTVRKFDSQNVEWKAGFGVAWAKVQIPEGKHTFVFDYQYSHSGGYFFEEGLSIAYDRFTAEHTYVLTAEPTPTGTKGLAIRVGVKDVTNEPDWAEFSFSNVFTWTQGFEWLPITRGKQP
ncbi:MAG: hypothetical protein LBT81_05270 [Helicobacteraceae bacterium]|jgi:hypothetical protein|nr:hypothetical protein [Helicobacteraceae bacterium]